MKKICSRISWIRAQKNEDIEKIADVMAEILIIVQVILLLK